MKKLPNEGLNRPAPEVFNQMPRKNFVVVLDNIRSMQNVGSVFRTCDAFACAGIYLGGITAKPPHREINKTALGATETVPWQHFDHTQMALQHLKQAGYIIVGIEQTVPRNYLNSFEPLATEKYAYVFGNEVYGLSDAALAQCDFCLEIPQLGAKHSINIAVSAGVVLWHHALGAGFF